ncbi:MAG: hypothetical protein HQK83_16635 [Fibrobacteria bacterium]|nr:hypothetical protein [Fibrobacteria bacterium]
MNKYFIIPLVLLSIVANSAIAQSGFGETGSVWMGGGFSFSSSGENVDDRQNLMAIGPVLRFFPADRIFVGPRLNWTRASDDNSSSNRFGLGGDIGFGTPSGNGAFVYMRSGIQLDMYSSKYDSDYYNNSSSDQGYTIPVAAGVIIPIRGILAVQIEPGFQVKFLDGESMNVVSLSLGFAGLGDFSVISCMSNMVNYYL